MVFETLKVNREGAVLFKDIAASPMNLSKEEFPAQMNAFFPSVARPATQDHRRQLLGLGLQQRGEAERHFSRYLERIV